MGKEPSIKKNILMNAVLTSSNFIFPMLTYSHVARVLLPSGTGKVAFVQSVLAYFAYIATLGIVGYGRRECAKIRNDKEGLSKLVQELFVINLSSTILAYVALVVSLLCVRKFREYTLLFIVMSINILLQTLGMEWLYQALEQYSYITIRSLVFKCISVALIFLLVRDTEDYVVYGALTIFTSSASNILNFFHARKYIEVKRYKEYNFTKHMKPIMIFFASGMIISIYGHFDSIMLGFIKGDADVGLYSAAYKMKAIVLALSSGIVSVLIPRLSLYANEEDSDKYLHLLLKSLQISCILFLPITMIVIMNATDVLEFLCGREYLSAAHTLVILMICSLVLCMTNLFGNQILIPKGQEKIFSRSVFVGMFINLGLNALLIPKLGAAGAAFATLVTELFNMIYMGWHVQKEIHFLKKKIYIHKYVIAIVLAVVGEIAIMFFSKNIQIIFIRLVINTIIFGGIYWAVLLYTKEAVVDQIVKSFLKRIFGS